MKRNKEDKFKRVAVLRRTDEAVDAIRVCGGFTLDKYVVFGAAIDLLIEHSEKDPAFLLDYLQRDKDTAKLEKMQESA